MNPLPMHILIDPIDNISHFKYFFFFLLEDYLIFNIKQSDVYTK